MAVAATTWLNCSRVTRLKRSRPSRSLFSCVLKSSTKEPTSQSTLWIEKRERARRERETRAPDRLKYGNCRQVSRSNHKSNWLATQVAIVTHCHVCNRVHLTLSVTFLASLSTTPSASYCVPVTDTYSLVSCSITEATVTAKGLMICPEVKGDDHYWSSLIATRTKLTLTDAASFRRDRGRGSKKRRKFIYFLFFPPSSQKAFYLLKLAIELWMNNRQINTRMHERWIINLPCDDLLFRFVPATRHLMRILSFSLLILQVELLHQNTGQKILHEKQN